MSSLLPSPAPPIDLPANEDDGISHVHRHRASCKNLPSNSDRQHIEQKATNKEQVHQLTKALTYSFTYSFIHSSIHTWTQTVNNPADDCFN